MNRALILMYHSVDEPQSPAEVRYCVRPSAFRDQMTWLADSDYQPVSLTQIVDAIRLGAPLPSKSVAVTFDDSLECFLHNALPELIRLSIPATMFAVAGKLGTANDWMHTEGGRARRLMDATQLRDVQAQGVAVGCHGLTHVPMTDITDVQLQDETLTARHILSDALATDVKLFAYPYGAQGQRERMAVATAGFIAACSTMSGFNRYDADLFALRRIDIYGGDQLPQFRRKLDFGANRVTYVDVARYYTERIRRRVHG